MGAETGEGEGEEEAGLVVSSGTKDLLGEVRKETRLTSRVPECLRRAQMRSGRHHGVGRKGGERKEEKRTRRRIDRAGEEPRGSRRES